MASKCVVHVDGTSLEREIDGNALLLVDFWAEWCAPCRAMAPSLERLADQYPDLRIVKVDAEANKTLLDAYQVKSIPTLLLFRSGKRVEQLVGKIPYTLMVRAVEEAR